MTGIATCVQAADELKAAGPDGIFSEDLALKLGYSPKDCDAGWLAHLLRKEGFLVQRSDRRLYILPSAPIAFGSWVRHKIHGVCCVTYERTGFAKVVIAPLGRVSEDRIAVHRSELSGV